MFEFKLDGRLPCCRERENGEMTIESYWRVLIARVWKLGQIEKIWSRGEGEDRDRWPLEWWMLRLGLRAKMDYHFVSPCSYCHVTKAVCGCVIRWLE